MKKKKELPPVEWSRPVDSEGISHDPRHETIAATNQEQQDLTNRLNVIDISDLIADVTLVRESGNRIIYVSGTVSANVTQQCVVTLDPVQQKIEASFEAWYAEPDRAISIVKVRQERASRVSGAEVEMLEEKNDPEDITDGQIDLGELATQHISLAIDPYPHKDGAEFEKSVDTVPVDAPTTKRQNPFARLKDWKNKADKDK